jgi:hypothetical protein
MMCVGLFTPCCLVECWSGSSDDRVPVEGGFKAKKALDGLRDALARSCRLSGSLGRVGTSTVVQLRYLMESGRHS